MPNQADDELNKLIEDQRKDRENSYVYPERINPRKSILFVGLSNRQRACLILSLFMKRKDIAEALRIKPGSVSQYRKLASKKLPAHELACLAKIRTFF